MRRTVILALCALAIIAMLAAGWGDPKAWEHPKPINIFIPYGQPTCAPANQEIPGDVNTHQKCTPR